jgi:hypothetical protein
MGVRFDSAPWWLTWVVAAGLAGVFIGERVMGGAGIARMVASGVGAVLLVGATAWRTVSWRAATAQGRRVEGLLLAAYIGCILAVGGYLLSSEDVMGWLGIAFQEAQMERRYEVVLQVFSSIVLAVSLLPALGAQWALLAHRHAGRGAAEVESRRVREIATGALTVALAGALLFLVGYVASERDASVDLSYFKTANPGTATQEVVRTFEDPLRTLVFFPEVNAVKDQVLGYFRTLQDATGNVEIEEHDRLISPRLAREHQVTTDGTILLLRGEQAERLTLPTALGTARSRLRTFDREVQERLIRLARDRRTAYLTVGHGEVNDPLQADSAAEADPLRQISGVRQLLRVLNYRATNLGLQQGLGQDVPEDAALVLVLGPRRPFLAAELEALDRYLARGGALLVALDPEGEFELAMLEDRLGVAYRPVPLADDRQHLRRRGNVSDRQLIVTDRFSSHEAVTTLSRTRVGSGILLVGSGYFEEAGEGELRRSFVIRSLPSTFADLNGNYEFDEGTEERSSYNLAVAIEGEADSTVGDAALRVLVFGDAEMFSDAVLASVGLNAALVADGVRWLGREESFSGAIESEEDVAIAHTKSEDVALFYSTIFGAPLLVLAAGLVSVFRRRRTRTVAP